MNIRPWQALVLAVALLAPQAPCSAAEVRPGEIPAWLRAGAPLRIRIERPGESRSITGQYAGGDDSTLYVASGFRDTVEVDVDRIVRLEVSQERGSHAWTGFTLGWLATGLASSAAMAAGEEINGTGALVLGAAFYGPLGGLLGAAVGGQVSKDRWVLIWDRSSKGR